MSMYVNSFQALICSNFDRFCLSEWILKLTGVIRNISVSSTMTGSCSSHWSGLTPGSCLDPSADVPSCFWCWTFESGDPLTCSISLLRDLYSAKNVLYRPSCRVVASVWKGMVKNGNFGVFQWLVAGNLKISVTREPKIGWNESKSQHHYSLGRIWKEYQLDWLREPGLCTTLLVAQRETQQHNWAKEIWKYITWILRGIADICQQKGKWYYLISALNLQEEILIYAAFWGWLKSMINLIHLALRQFLELRLRAVIIDWITLKYMNSMKDLLIASFDRRSLGYTRVWNRPTLLKLSVMFSSLDMLSALVLRYCSGFTSWPESSCWIFFLFGLGGACPTADLPLLQSVSRLALDTGNLYSR